MGRPNVIFICTDQQRFDSLGCLGHPSVRTPNLDRLAGEGVRFARHITPNQICSPSRGTMFTGLYPRSHGLYCNGIALDQSLPTLPGAFCDGGYRTHAVGKMHLQPELAPAEYNLPESMAFWDDDRNRDWNGPYYGFQTVDLVIGHGRHSVESGHYANWLRETDPSASDLYSFDRALEEPQEGIDCWKLGMPSELHYNTYIADRSVDFLRRVEDPFFLFVSFPDPHHPFAAPRPYCDRHDPVGVVMPTVVDGELDRMPPYYLQPQHPDAQGGMLLSNNIGESALRMAIAQTYGLVEMIDDCVGRIMTQLHDSGLADDTIVLFTSDHGELLGDHGVVRKGPPPYRQLTEVPLLLAGPGAPRGEQITAMTSHIDLAPTLLEMAGLDPMQMNAEGVSLAPILSGAADSVRSALLAEYHPRGDAELYNQTIRTDRWRMTLYHHHPDWGELFDLQDDPFEHHNLFGEPEASATIDRLRERLAAEFPPSPKIDAERIARY
jgi:arylsulfatase A-like enzyme